MQMPGCHLNIHLNSVNDVDVSLLSPSYLDLLMHLNHSFTCLSISISSFLILCILMLLEVVLLFTSFLILPSFVNLNFIFLEMLELIFISHSESN
jgi:hypothetical protein